ncbi:MAG TPA: LytR C-terminal domain-containing protein [Arachnia sp.]|mgnify:CR=1 FL=1|nr:LytR C-terminal domain-containing protein [Arachnia sp.]HMT86790.1 LytR C-terminal domain-containing protein [Arachnia sp.]
MRLFRLIATPIVLLALLGFLLWAGRWGWRELTAPIPTPEPTPCVTQPVDVVVPQNVSVRVLNGGFTSGLAGKASKHLESAGFTILTVGNTDERIMATLIRGNIQNEAALELTASYFASATIEHDDRVDGTIDVLVGSEFAGFGEGPLLENPSNTGNLCVPPTPDPTPVSGSPSPAVSPPAEGE